MNKAQAYHSFWSGFGLTAYDENTVPDGEDKPDFPYITYEYQESDFNNDLVLSASLWYKGDSWEAITNKYTEISNSIGRGGKVVQCDSGRIWIRKYNPFGTRMSDTKDKSIRRMLLRVQVEFQTEL